MAADYQMNPEIKRRWIAALTSGEYKQGRAALVISPDDEHDEPRYCCLGVLCVLAQQEGVGEFIGNVFKDDEDKYSDDEGSGRFESDAELTIGVQEWSDIHTVYGLFFDEHDKAQTLATLNDGGMPFSEIAKIIDANF